MQTIDILVEDAERLVARIRESARSRTSRWGDVPNAPSTAVGQGFGGIGTRLEVAVDRLRDLGTEGASRFGRHGQTLSGLLQSVGQSDGASADILRGMISNDEASL